MWFNSWADLMRVHLVGCAARSALMGALGLSQHDPQRLVRLS